MRDQSIQTLDSFSKVSRVDSIKIDSINYSQLLETLDSINHSLNQEKFFTYFSYDVILSSLLTAFLTIFIFQLGIRKERKAKEQRLIEEKNRSLRAQINKCIQELKFLSIWSEKSIALGRKQAEAYVELSESDILNNRITRIPPQVFSDAFDQVLSIDYSPLLVAVNNQEKLLNLRSSAFFLKNVIITANEEYIQFRREEDSERLEFQTRSNAYMDQIGNMLLYFKQNREEFDKSEELQALKVLIDQSIILFHNQEGKKDIKVFINNIVRVIQIFIIESKLYEQSDKYLKLADEGKALTYLYSYMTHGITLFKKQFLEFAKQLNESSSKIEELINELEIISPEELEQKNDVTPQIQN